VNQNRKVKKNQNLKRKIYQNKVQKVKIHFQDWMNQIVIRVTQNLIRI
jgi:hypothetical protein